MNKRTVNKKPKRNPITLEEI